jgi:ubiquinone/menaquinone biosynthesis C-methylase UbiE
MIPLSYMRCPECRSQFYPCAATSIACLKGHRFPVVNDVPQFVNCTSLTKDTFDFKWKRIPSYGYDKATEKFRTKWYMERYGWTDFDSFMSESDVLDVGTGLGSQVAMYASKTKGVVFGMDISDSVYEARKRLSKVKNAYFVQADLHNMPFKEGSFDFVCSDQVLHHTPDTRKAFLSLVPMVKNGGQIAFYVYKKKGQARELCDDFLRERTTKMSGAECLAFSEAVTSFGKNLSQKDVDFQREVYWGMFKCFWNPKFDFKTNVLVNFDWYHPQYAWRHTVEEVESWIAEAGLTILHIDRDSKSGISVRAQK